ncbi:ABC transporter substrate-binding protein [Streptomyces sp. MST-110588]|uniref:ABC transporter substrate-binding protein n=1 Tax=Streptomyces sp. MST-110588 TaxID=2833628 RepID=UPI001F5D02B2|nr:ABC transporter substrate-binding protein [Streptomyces sp. MST-110588]UNO44201.1 ABC transporter substrate-binding protein [Streptomyces sp. MST-110588]
MTVAVVATLAAGCGGGSSGGSGDSGSGSGSGDGGTAGFPVSVTDCEGRRTTFSRPPAKIVTSNASALDMLLRLGAGDRIVGTGFPPGKGTLPGELDARAQKVPVLGKAVIPKEKLLGSGADLYVDTFASMGNMGAAGDLPSEAEFSAAGIKHVFLASTACAPKKNAPQRDLSGVEGDIRRLGAITGTSRRALELVRGMEKKVAAVRKAVAGVPEARRPTYFFFDFDAGTKQPIAVCNRQVANAVMTQAGARNVFADCAGDFKPVSWEDIVKKDPDWIQLGVRRRGDPAADRKAFAQAEEFLREFPGTAGLRAVKEGRFLRIGSEETTIAGVGNADTVEKIARTLYPGQMGQVGEKGQTGEKGPSGEKGQAG